MNKYSWHCCMCGRFVGWGADQSVYYGNSWDMEPPDPDYYCKVCAEKEKQEVIKRGKAHGCFWVQPIWQIEAIRILEEAYEQAND